MIQNYGYWYMIHRIYLKYKKNVFQKYFLGIDIGILSRIILLCCAILQAEENLAFQLTIYTNTAALSRYYDNQTLPRFQPPPNFPFLHLGNLFKGL